MSILIKDMKMPENDTTLWIINYNGKFIAVNFENENSRYEVIEVPTPHGRWIPEGGGFWKCNQCGYGVEPYNNTPFCPNCGTDMRENKEKYYEVYYKEGKIL